MSSGNFCCSAVEIQIVGESGTSGFDTLERHDISLVFIDANLLVLVAIRIVRLEIISSPQL